MGHTRRAALAVGMVALAFGHACRCNSGLGNVELGFRVSGDTVDFGRVLEGAQVLRTVTLFSESRADQEVGVSTEGPFAAAGSVTVPAGGTAEVAVTFTAGSAREEGALLLSARGDSVRVPLVGEGVRPLPCVPSGPCRVSRFDLETSQCIETDAVEGARCTPSDECLENGTCRAGQCLGTPRSCDDQNKCTTDACAKGVGCVHAPVNCPTPTADCRVATCDPAAGCGQGPAPDDYVCGSVDCRISNLCIGGVCKQLNTPNGVRCSLATPCQGAGTCQNQVCVRPDAGELTPEYALVVPHAPVGDLREEPVLLAHQGNLFWQACGDGGVDAGCFLASFTGSGFQRFLVPLPDASYSRLAQVGDGGVVLVTDQALWVHSPGSGAALASYPYSALTPPDAGPALARTAANRLARAEGGELYAAFDWWSAPDAGDGGPASFAGQTLVRLAQDGGREELSVPKGRGSQLALDIEGGLQLYGVEGSRLTLRESDGGRTFTDGPDQAADVPALLSVGQRVLLGGRYLYALDGGLVADLGAADAGLRERLPHYAVAGRGLTYLFERRCLPEASSCMPEALAPFVRAYDNSTGALSWVASLAEQPGGVVLESAAGESNSLLTLTREGPDAGGPAVVSLVLSGSRVYQCPLPPDGVVGGAVFSRGFLFVLVERAGGWRLEAYDLLSTPVAGAGWPQRFGVSGQRRAQP